MKQRFAASILIIGAVMAADAAAQARSEVLVKQRQAKMTLQGKYAGPLFGMARGRIPYDAATAQRNAGFIEALSKMAWDGFDPSTKGVKSHALPEVFSEPAKFRAAAERFEAEASKLAAVSKSGDEAAVKAQIGAMGKACQSCHDQFQENQ